MIPSQNQQAHLADFAPKQSLDKYAKGADPRVINGIVALSEMQQQAAMRQQANLANGAAQGQMPTVRDKIMQMFQQANQPRQQPQQQPNPMQQGIMAQAHPQMQTAPMPQGEAPEEAQMYHGGVAHLPVNDRMFGYANGGIIAFSDGKRPEDKEEYTADDEKLTPEQAKEILDRITAGGRAPSASPSQRPSQPESPESPEAFLARRGEQIRNAPRAPVSQEARPMFPFATAGRNTPRGGINEFDDRPIERVGTEPTPTAAPTAAPIAPTRSPADQAEHDRLDKIYKAQTTGIANTGQKTVGGFTLSETIEKARERLEAEGKKLTPDDVRVIQRRFEGANPDAGSGKIKTAPGATPPVVSTTPPQRTAVPSGNATVNPNAPAAGTGIDALLARQANRLATQSTGPQLPEPDMAANTLKLLEAQDKYVRENPNSPAADKLLQYYDDMRKRAIADDNAQLAQRAEDARNNLWTLLTNTKGSSLAAGAGRANAALQPLLSEQKAAATAYRKYSYERDMNREKAYAEAMAAEEARKRGDFTKAIEYEKNERAYRLEAKKADDLAQHYRNTEMNQVLSTAATRESAKEGHLTQVQVANINAAAQRAGFDKPSEMERMVKEYNDRVAKDGQKAADAWLASVGKVAGVTKGYDVKEESLNVQRDKAVTTALKVVEPYTRALSKIASLESKARAGKLTPAQQAELDAARADAKRYYDKKYQEIHRTAPPDRSSGGGFPVTAPDGNTYNFKTQAEADAFRAKIGG